MSVFDSPFFDQHEYVVSHCCPESGLKAIVAIHSSQLGPAIGGCRMYPYVSGAAALDDALRLSRGMTYKSALAGLPLGGGKSVIIGDPRRHKTPELLKAMAEFINTLNGRYITAEDSGTSVEDMAIMRRTSRYVLGAENLQHIGADPSPYTARGVYLGICAALAWRGEGDLSGKRVAIQGGGAVGAALCRLLLGAGAHVFVADPDTRRCEALQALGAVVVPVDQVLFWEADVLAPCAMGGVISPATAARIRAKVVAGAANNMLVDGHLADQLADRDILYVPDFAINAGGIMAVHCQYSGETLAELEHRLEAIPDTLNRVFALAESGVSTHVAAERLAAERLGMPTSGPLRRAG